MVILTKKEARDFLVNYHNINTNTVMSIGEVMNRIHTIQYDPLSVVGTNPELVLQARVKNFKRQDLDKELYQTRTLIDQWDKQMSIIETSYFPHYQRVRDNRSNGTLAGYKKHFNIDASDYIDDVLKIVTEEGPILSSSIKTTSKLKHKWGHTKPSTIALDYLFHKGMIGVESRKHRQKRYDLIDRLISVDRNDPFDNDQEFLVWYMLRRIEACGLLSNKSGVHVSGTLIGNKENRNHALKILLQNGDIEEVKVKGINETLYVPKNALSYPINIQDKVTYIAPLDNLIWDRKLIKQLFDFDYTWEVYTPVSKRVYGYYVLPILRGSRFIGRIEFHPYKDTLTVKNIFLEEGIKETKILKQKLNQADKRLLKYLS